MITATLIISLLGSLPALLVNPPLPGPLPGPPSADRAIVSVTTFEVPLPGEPGGTARSYVFTIADGATVAIVRRYAPRPAPPDGDAGLLEITLHQLLLAERIRIAQAEADDVFAEAEAAARAWPWMRHIGVGLGEGRGAIEGRWAAPLVADQPPGPLPPLVPPKPWVCPACTCGCDYGLKCHCRWADGRDQ